MEQLFILSIKAGYTLWVILITSADSHANAKAACVFPTGPRKVMGNDMSTVQFPLSDAPRRASWTNIEIQFACTGI